MGIIPSRKITNLLKKQVSTLAVTWKGVRVWHPAGKVQICWGSKSALSLLHGEVYGYDT